MEIISHNISTISSYIPIISNHIQLFGWLFKKIAMSILLSIPTKNRLRWLCLKSWSTLIYQGLSIQRLKRTPGSFKVPPKKNYIRPYIGLIYGRYLQFRFLKMAIDYRLCGDIPLAALAIDQFLPGPSWPSCSAAPLRASRACSVPLGVGCRVLKRLRLPWCPLVMLKLNLLNWIGGFKCFLVFSSVSNIQKGWLVEITVLLVLEWVAKTC